MNSPNMFYIGGNKVNLNDFQEKEKLQLRIKNLLLLRNVNFLFGNGTSLSLGAPSISNYKAFIEKLNNKFSDGKESEKFAYNAVSDVMKDKFEKALIFLNKFNENIDKDIDFETVLSIFIQISYTSDKILIQGNEYDIDSIKSAINLIKAFIFFSCKNFLEKINNDKLRIHKEFLRRALLRSTTLPRVKLFTTNYDLILEKCLDENGVFYFDGFVGSFEKRLRTESYNYDLYYPGEITEGNVNRVDRVMQLYKLHGSINWKRVKETSENIYGIKQEYPYANEISNLVIYPSTLKYGETLGYPYSEMFRLFSASLFKPQTVLFTFGYSFKDEHVNRIIYQALTIPTFNLVIVLPEGKEKDEKGNYINDELTRLIDNVSSKRILVISGGQLNNGELTGAGTFNGFVEEIMPDMEEMKTQEKINEEIEKLFSKKESKENKISKEVIEEEVHKQSEQNAPEATGITKIIKRVFKQR